MSQNKIKPLLSNTFMLVFLYSLQGLVLALFLESFSLKLISNFSISEIGIFMMCGYPYSLKILWAPIIDTYYIKSIGKRKTWILLAQFIVALLLFYLSYVFDDLYEEKNLILLTTICFICVFFVATQDIALDGWALTLCGKEVK